MPTATENHAHEAMVIELRLAAGTYTALIKALTGDKSKLSMLSLAGEIERAAKPVQIPEDNGSTCLPSID